MTARQFRAVSPISYGFLKKKNVLAIASRNVVTERAAYIREFFATKGQAGFVFAIFLGGIYIFFKGKEKKTIISF